MEYRDIIERRRHFSMNGFATLADVDFDGDWVTPYQTISAARHGPCIVAFNWLDVPSVERNRQTLKRFGYLPGILFNKVIDRALKLAGLTRSDIYVTQAFHLLPERRSQSVPQRAVNASFDAITRFEVVDRKVIALGSAAAMSCRVFAVPHISVRHPSARGLTIETKAKEIASAMLRSPE